jgi:hypothetical protein
MRACHMNDYGLQEGEKENFAYLLDSSNVHDDSSLKHLSKPCLNHEGSNLALSISSRCVLVSHDVCWEEGKRKMATTGRAEKKAQTKLREVRRLVSQCGKQRVHLFLPCMLVRSAHNAF